MNASEFKELTDGEGVYSAQQWEIVETVYNFHPLIPDFGGKEKIAQLFKLGGIGLLSDMLPAARTAQALEEAVREAKNELSLAQARLDSAANLVKEFRKGYGV
jgi:hypothetical protein